MRQTLVFLSTLFLFCNVATADETLSLKVGYQMLKPSGQVAGNVGAIGTHIDVGSNLNLKNSNQPTGEVALQFGDSRLSLGFVPMKFKGSGTVNANFNFNGQTYTVGTPVSSEFKGDLYDIGYTYYIVNMDDMPSRFQLGIEAAAKVIHASATVTGLGITQSSSATAVIPTIGARARIALADFVGLVGRVGYIGYSGNRFLDADAQVEFSPIPTMGIYGGYRSLQVKVDKSGLFVDTKFQGPYVGGFIRF